MFLERARFKTFKKHQNTFRRSYFYTLAQLDINAIKTFEQQQKRKENWILWQVLHFRTINKLLCYAVFAMTRQFNF